ncbi:MAG: RNA-binding S4 domain-containing protein [Acidobacteriota bacterium]|nr:RNA-binding S4 domain-containing protein [Blastocatellia bacterium]MDW8411497.1 RNA-binding S4 domain-containing protein [Acidobacteriota bacterium]
MRLDVFLKLSRLVVRRSIAAQMCREGKVFVNGILAKPSRELRPGDVLEISRRGEKLACKVLNIPTGQVSKATASTLYELLYSQRQTEEL